MVAVEEVAVAAVVDVVDERANSHSLCTPQSAKMYNLNSLLFVV